MNLTLTRQPIRSGATEVVFSSPDPLGPAVIVDRGQWARDGAPETVTLQFTVPRR